MERHTIKTASKSYPLYIGEGLRHRLASIFADLKQSFSSILIITDERVAELYLQDTLSALGNEKRVFFHIVKSGEKAKSFDVFYECQTAALEKGLDRKSCIVALGGGVIGDLAGFVAATFMRGIGFIQMPTTLLAHDSSVGGKTAINHPAGKNMIGSFYQPDAVIYDSETLHSLPYKEKRSGFAEVIKHALISDNAFYKHLRKEIPSKDGLKSAALAEEIRRGIMVKAEIVDQDEKETGVRAYLNFGHTLGQAIEAELGYGKMTHGDAVAVGMLFAMRLSETYDGIKLPVKEIEEWMISLGYPLSVLNRLDAEKLLRRMKKDKKAEHGDIRFVLMEKIGVVKTVPVPDGMILDVLRDETGTNLY
jgi:3-dehydroquinate synthase